MVDLIDIITSAGTFRLFFSAIQATDLIDTIREGVFTIFAPDDQAFAKLAPDELDGLLKDTPKLTAVVMYHIIGGRLSIDEISKMDTVKTIQGQEVKIDAQKWHLHVKPKINDANITNLDILADNGVIHVLDRVLMPNMALTCPKCGMGFMNIEALNTHTKIGHAEAKEQELMVPKETTLVAEKTVESMPITHEVPLRGLTPNQIPCPVCGRPFKSHSEMKRHLDSTHHESKGHED
jgi:uncharacterized C2H2 Zn-finger protein